MKVAVVGASGYTGAELVRLLEKHPQAELTVITSRQYEGQPMGACFPGLGDVALDFSSHETDEMFERADFFFTALPHAASMEMVGRIADAGKRVVDLSADFRFADTDTYEATYGKHTRPDLVAASVYGLPEINGERVKEAEVVGNPGCYPTSALLPLIPLVREGLVDPGSIIIDSKSGVSGAGRQANLVTHYCEANESMKAYKVAAHRHTPEIEAHLFASLDEKPSLIFTPHLTPMNRGILSTIYATPSEGVASARVVEAWEDVYADAPFAVPMGGDTLPDTAFVRGTNKCMFAARDHAAAGKVIIVSAIDNLVKGASGQAIQNMNLMMGFEEISGLPLSPVFP